MTAITLKKVTVFTSCGRLDRFLNCSLFRDEGKYHFVAHI